jgi:hypothetical protein
MSSDEVLYGAADSLWDGDLAQALDAYDEATEYDGEYGLNALAAFDDAAKAWQNRTGLDFTHLYRWSYTTPPPHQHHQPDHPETRTTSDRGVQ